MLTPEQRATLHKTQLANIAKKLAAGKTITAREQRLLDGPDDSGSAFAKTWDELADACNVDRRTLTNARTNFGKACPKDRPDGRKEIAAWIAFLDEKGIRGRGVNNPDIAFIDERNLRLQREQFQLEKAKYELKCAKDQTVPVAHVEAALGHMLARFRQALDSLPGRIASGIDEADQAELLKLLARAEREKLSFKKLRAMIEKGQARAFTDIHARRAYVESEVRALQVLLTRCDYLEADPAADEEE